MKRFLVAALALVFATPFSAAPEQARALETPAAIRALTDAPESARINDARAEEVVARDSRVPQHHTRPAAQAPLAPAANVSDAPIAAHARTSGLAAPPHTARALAIPFDATAPPVTQRS